MANARAHRVPAVARLGQGRRWGRGPPPRPTCPRHPARARLPREAPASAAPPRNASPCPGRTSEAATALEPRQRRERQLRVRRERRHLRPAPPRRDGVGAHRVADEQGVVAGEVERRAARRVPRHVDHARRAGHVQRRAVPVRGHLAQVRDAEQPVTERPPPEPQHRPDPHRPCRLPQGSAPRRAPARHRPRAPRRASRAPGAPAPRSPRGRCGRASARWRGRRPGCGPSPPAPARPAPEPRCTGVDDRDLAALLDEVRVDDAVVTDAADAWGDLHRDIATRG